MSTQMIRATAAIELKVESRDGAAIGTVHGFVVDKATGQGRFAILSLGGFLGMGKSFYPVPFAMIAFDPVRDVYVAGLDRKQLEGGPSWANNPPEFDAPYTAGVVRYYDAPQQTGTA